MAEQEKTSRAPVIQIIKGAELTRSEQLLNRVLPACVASAGIHVALAAGVFALSALAPVGTKAEEPDKVEVAVEESNEKPEDKNLTETTPSIDESSTTVVIEDAIAARVANVTLQQKLDEWRSRPHALLGSWLLDVGQGDEAHQRLRHARWLCSRAGHEGRARAIDALLRRRRAA